MRAPDKEAPRPLAGGTGRESDWTQTTTNLEITRRSSVMLAAAATILRRAADRLESRAASIGRRRLLRVLALDGAFSGPVQTQHARASLVLDRLDSRLCELREFAR